MKKRILSLLLVIFMIVPAPAVFASETCTHDWSDWTEVSSPDCGHSGVTSRYCYNCDEEQRLTIPATGKHDWSDWWIVKKSTVFKTGTKKRECWICDKTQTVSIPKLKPFVKLNKKTISLTAGKSYRLKASYAKGDSVKKCKSSNKKVATVSKKEVISARQAGKVRITIYTKSGKKATCKVTVTAKKKAAKKSSSNKSGSGSGSSKTNGSTVYWTPGGAVYHRTPNCPTLSRSRTIYHGSISSCPKNRGCKVCF